MGAGFEYDPVALGQVASELKRDAEDLNRTLSAQTGAMSVPSGAFGKLPESHQAESNYQQNSVPSALQLVPALHKVLQDGGKNLAMTLANYQTAEKNATVSAGG